MCTPPWCRSTLVGLPDGVGDFLPLREDVGFPWVPLSLISYIRYNVTHSKLPLYEHSA